MAVSASQIIQAAAPSSRSHFPLCKPETRRSSAGPLRETRDERKPQRATKHRPVRNRRDRDLAEGKRRRLKPSPLSGHAPTQGGEPARHPAQSSSSSSSSSLSARRRPVCESTAILLVSPFMDPVTSIYLPLREMRTFDHPSV